MVYFYLRRYTKINIEEISSIVAQGFVNTGIEGPFNNVCCSTAGDYPSIGVCSWEGDRGNELLSTITGGDYYIGRSYSDIESAGEIDYLSALLDSEEGQAAQLEILANDCADYVQELSDNISSLDDTKCMIYCAMWCSTSTYVVRKFLQNRESAYNYRNLEVLRDLFASQYAQAADCSEYQDGYYNRAFNQYNYVNSLDI